MRDRRTLMAIADQDSSVLARRFVAVVLAAMLVVVSPLTEAASSDAALPSADPESVGFSSERLRRLDGVMQRAVDEKEFAGVVTLLARHGKVIRFRALGKQDLASGAGLKQDTIFRIFSMSKPVTAAAMMILYEEGKWNPLDPISKFIPQFAGLKVYSGKIDFLGKLQLEDPAHTPTMRELMTHTAGFGYGGEQTPVDRFYRDETDKGIFESGSLQAMIERVAKAPLLYQPSTRWKYSLSMDIQGYIIERLSGMTLPEFMKKRLFEPLGMKDTDFYVPPEKRRRFATLYEMADKEGSALDPVKPYPPFMDYEKEPALPSGGGGLVSTAADYFRFAQMLLNGGELDGVRILGPQTVKLMMSNHLPESLTSEFKGGGFVVQPRPGVGYGFNGAVVTDPGQADIPVGKGTYMWDGAAGTWFWIDPTNDIVFVGMIQRLCYFARPCRSAQDSVMGMPPSLEEMSRATTYQALLRPEL
jgi:CubicO group peptidase (beta-lactamase class C family)